MWNLAIDSVALLAVGGLWGGMVFFAFVYAPLIFWKLEASAAGQFIRQVFPVYYLALGVSSAIAAAALALVCAGFWVVRQSLVPIINRTRDASLAGDARAGRQFKRLKLPSPIICQRTPSAWT